MLDAPSGSRHQRRVFRPTIHLSMILVAVSALVFCGVRYNRDMAAREARRVMLKADLSRAETRAAWATEMNRKGYVSKAQLLADQLALSTIEQELKDLEGR